MSRIAEPPSTEVAPTRSRTKRVVRAAALALVVVLAATGCNYTPEQLRVTELVNNSRDNHGRRPVRQEFQLTSKAQQWAEYLARINRLEHSDLSDGAPSGWRRLGENVGYGGRIYDIHRAYMNSSGHRANILDNRFNYIGTGHAKRGSRHFTVQVFMQK